MRKILIAIMMTASVMLFSGCGRSNDDIYTDAKPVVEKIIKDNLDLNSTCTRLLDIRKVDANHYKATAEVKYRDALGEEKTELLDVSIAYDNDTIIVKIED